jgi:hypothetical protein
MVPSILVAATRSRRPGYLAATTRLEFRTGYGRLLFFFCVLRPPFQEPYLLLPPRVGPCKPLRLKGAEARIGLWRHEGKEENGEHEGENGHEEDCDCWRRK